MPGKFVIKTSKNGKIRFNVKASNGQIILTSETYETRKAAESGIAAVKKNAVVDGRFERKTARDGSVYFVLKASNGEIVGKSEHYPTLAGLETGISTVKTNAETAKVVS